MQKEIDECRCPGCEKLMPINEMERVYDNHGIYAGRWCSWECANRNMNLCYTAFDALENGECIEEDY